MRVAAPGWCQAPLQLRFQALHTRGGVAEDEGVGPGAERTLAVNLVGLEEAQLVAPAIIVGTALDAGFHAARAFGPQQGRHHHAAARVQGHGLWAEAVGPVGEGRVLAASCGAELPIQTHAGAGSRRFLARDDSGVAALQALLEAIVANAGCQAEGAALQTVLQVDALNALVEARSSAGPADAPRVVADIGDRRVVVGPPIGGCVAEGG